VVPSTLGQGYRLLLRPHWAQRWEIVALGNGTAVWWLGLQRVVFWFQQHFENQNVVRNSKKLQKPEDKRG